MKFLTQISMFFLLAALIACGGTKGSPEEEAAWKEVNAKNTLTALDSFLVQFPQTNRKAEVAKRREGVLFQIAVSENTEYHYRKYLKEFPQGKRKKDIEKKLADLPKDVIAAENLGNKTFVGTIRYLDGSKPDIEVLSLIFSELEDGGESIRFKAALHLTSDVKKVLTGTISKPGMNIKFEEGTDDSFLVEIPEGRAYMRNGSIVLEATDPAQKQYWRLK